MQAASDLCINEFYFVIFAQKSECSKVGNARDFGHNSECTELDIAKSIKVSKLIDKKCNFDIIYEVFFAYEFKEDENETAI